jgi:hypothetical protein
LLLGVSVDGTNANNDPVSKDSMEGTYPLANLASHLALSHQHRWSHHAVVFGCAWLGGRENSLATLSTSLPQPIYATVNC